MNAFDLSVNLKFSDLELSVRQMEDEISLALDSASPAISNSIKLLSSSKGKRLRPSLLLATVFHLGARIDQKTINACTAIELVHVGSVVHDDVIDESRTRWGKPTVNDKYGSKQAVVVGDYLLSKANGQAALAGTAVAGLISSTITQLCEGESLEITDQFNLDRSIESLLSVIQNKTASLISAACQLGGMHAGADEKTISALSLFGKEFGTAFQLIDDLLDFLSTPELLGKPVLNDVMSGIYTMPLLLALASQDREKTISLLRDNKKAYLNNLIKLLIDHGYVTSSINTARQHCQLAANALKGFELLQGVVDLPSKYLQWAVSNLIAPEHRAVL